VDLRIDPTRATPPSRQIVEAVLDAVASGATVPGDRLPSVRALAADALVNPNTAGKAYRELEALGVVLSRMGDGVFVAAEGPAIARSERQDATLHALREAGAAALRAGHAPEDVRAEIDRLTRAVRLKTAAGGKR
jgi:DNA-binding transcriptional regulator YhcF (GntR family)